MNIEWVDEAAKLTVALLEGNHFTAWEILERLHPEVSEYIKALLETKSTD